MGFSILIESFIVTVIGGMGSIAGAFVASILLGLTRAFGTIDFPLFTDGLMFLFMAVVLLVRPTAFSEGYPDMSVARSALGEACIVLAGSIVVLAAVLLSGSPLLADASVRLSIFGLFAMSLNLLLTVAFGNARGSCWRLLNPANCHLPRLSDLGVLDAVPRCDLELGVAHWCTGKVRKAQLRATYGAFCCGTLSGLATALKLHRN